MRRVHCHPPIYSTKWLRLEALSHYLYPRTTLCYWSLQHVYCLYTTEEAHLVMPSLPVSICAHQRELASKIKTESKTLLYDSITPALSQTEWATEEGYVRLHIYAGKKNKHNPVLAGNKWLITLCVVFGKWESSNKTNPGISVKFCNTANCTGGKL